MPLRLIPSVWKCLKVAGTLHVWLQRQWYSIHLASDVRRSQRLLAFARQQPLSPQPIDANKLVSGISDLLRRTIGETVSLLAAANRA